MLATYTVDTHADVVDPSDGALTLREAVAAANASVRVPDFIEFSNQLAGRTIILTEGHIDITDALDITGLGADLLTVDASGSDPTPSIMDGEGDTIFHIEGVDDPRGVTIQRLTLTGGDTGFAGGAIHADVVTVRDVVIRNNRSRGSGGGIFADTLTVYDTVIRDNASQGSGGGVAGDVVTVFNSVIRNNSVLDIGGSQASGGGIRAFNDLFLDQVLIEGNDSGYDGGGFRAGRATITNSTIANNFAQEEGGGFRAAGATIANSTVSGNIAGDKGGGIRLDFGQISTTTILDNSAGLGGGAHVLGAPTIENSIVARNEGGDLAVSRFAAVIRYSLIGVPIGTGLRPTPEGETDANGNIVGSSINPMDPQLGPLANNGGRTSTHLLLDGSPAINGGDPEFTAGPSGLDQRGQPRVSGTRVDMGSVEFQLPSIDFSGNGVHDCQDVDLIVSSIAVGIHPQQFDINGDGQVDHTDLTEWLTIAGLAHESGEPFREGDANLDGVADGTDFGIWNENRFTNTPEWCSGDFNADGNVDGSDFNNWLQERFERPEPVGRAAIVGETRQRLPRAPLRSFIQLGDPIGPIPRDAVTLLAATDIAFTYVRGIEFEHNILRAWQPPERPHRFAVSTTTDEDSYRDEGQQEVMARLVDSVIGTWNSL